MKILGIESSCDESAVAIVDHEKNILFNRIFSQDHKKYKGVFPEIAAREHLKILPAFLEEARPYFTSLDGIAVTIGPGLVGSLIIGIMLARSLSLCLKKPLIPVNHLEGHALSARLCANIEFPFLLLLISGGHSKIILVQSVGHYIELGTTRDDAFGEAFDKVAVMLGLNYPGGPEIEKYARLGNNKAFIFPQPMANSNSCDFSLSGLKTAVKHQLGKLLKEKEKLDHQIICDICASFQECISEIIIAKMQRAIDTINNNNNNIEAIEAKIEDNNVNECNRLASLKLKGKLKGIVAAGGVAANHYIRNKLETLSMKNKINFYAPPLHLCTDNAIMIAWTAIERWQNNIINFTEQSFEPKSRFPL